MSPPNGHQPWNTSQGDSPGNQPVREDQVSMALRFLNDPRTKSATQQEKESFLRRKGLTDVEISAAFSRAHASLPIPSELSGQPVYVRPAFMDEPILWSALKSIFSAVGAIAIGVMGYHVYRENTPASVSQPQTPDSASDPLSQFRSDSGISEERFKEAIDQITARQELRHKELLVSIRELSMTLKDSPTRKPGGSVVVDDGRDTTCQEAEAIPDQVEASTAPDGSMENDIDLVAEVKRAVEGGLDGTLLLLLSSLDTNKKLNKSNQRFKKLEGNKLFAYCGYNDRGDFFELATDQHFRLRAREVLDAIKLHRKADAPASGGGLIPAPKSVTDEPAVPAPWLIPKAQEIDVSPGVNADV